MQLQCLDVARERVVAFVAMHVHAQPALGGQLAEQLHAGRAFVHRALEVRDAADDFDAQVQRAFQVGQGAGCAQDAILRKGHQLQIEPAGDAVLHLQQCTHRKQPVVADIDMRAGCWRSARMWTCATIGCSRSRRCCM